MAGKRDEWYEQFDGMGGRGWYDGWIDAMHRQGPYAGRGPRNYKRSDVRIAEDVNDLLTHHSRIDATDIEVSVQDGEVTLRGFVESRPAKRLAEDIAESVFGVKDIYNQLRIRPRSESQRKAS